MLGNETEGEAEDKVEGSTMEVSEVTLLWKLAEKCMLLLMSNKTCMLDLMRFDLQPGLWMNLQSVLQSG